ncbi:MAG TPA: sugar-binding protein [Myxococcales bacterium]|nr:sugar-binding protein [Myxococcales bacterium]
MRKLALAVALSSSLSAARAWAALIVPPFVADGGHQNDALIHDGLLDATLYGADPTGQTDSTAAIQAAIDDGRDYLLTTYLPAGTYLISDTLLGTENSATGGYGWCYNTQSNPGTATTDWGTAQAPTLVGPPTGPRAVLKLADASSGFGDPTNPKPAIHFVDLGPASQYVNATVGAYDCLMYSVIRDVDFELGNNPGAIGVQFYSAQYSYMSDVSVDATNAYAGIEGAPATSDWVNLSVNGGQYGLLLDNAGTSSLVGISLSNQSVSGLSYSGLGATTLVGFQITEAAAAPVVISPCNGVPQINAFALVDGTITQQSGSGPAIANASAVNLFVQNVYVQTPGTLVQSGSATVAGSGATDLVAEYAYTDTALTGADYAPNTSYDLVNGVIGQQGVSSVQLGAGPPPGDLLLRHLPGPLPWPTDPAALDVTSFGADPTGYVDSTAAIQQAIQASLGQGDEVFLPRGTYLVSGTLTLNPNTRLFGIPGPKTTLWASTWNPQGQFVPFVQTANTAAGRTFVGDVQIATPNDDADGLGLAQSYLGAIDWQAGASSILWHAVVNLTPDWGTNPDLSSAATDLVHVEQNGGGRWYGLQLTADFTATRTENPAYRFLLVDGTSAPLTLYGPNFEHANGDDFVEVRNAANVRVMETKTECRTTWLAVEGSSNVGLYGLGGDWAPENTGVGLSVDASTNVQAVNLGWYGSEGGTGTSSWWYAYAAGGGFADAGVNWDDGVSLLQEGTFDETHFPHCGDGSCDGAETSVNCPQDCGGGTTGSAAGGTVGSTGGGSTGGASSGGTTSGGTSSGGNVWTACRAPKAFAIGGDLSAWSGVPSFLLPHTDAVVAPTSPVAPASDAQLSATVQTAWDATALYVLVQVTDPTVVDFPDASYPYENDSVELYVDGTDSRLAAYDAGDYQLTVTAFGEAAAYQDGPSLGSAGFSYAAVRTGGGYAVEYGVPWALLVGNDAGTVGFDVAVNGNDGGGPWRESQLMWSGDGGAYRDPQQFGRLVLGGEVCGVAGGTGGGSNGGGSTGAVSTTGGAGSSTGRGGSGGGTGTSTSGGGASTGSGSATAAPSGGCSCGGSGGLDGTLLAALSLAGLLGRRRRALRAGRP